jgi:hypothetical protein
MLDSDENRIIFNSLKMSSDFLEHPIRLPHHRSLRTCAPYSEFLWCGENWNWNRVLLLSARTPSSLFTHLLSRLKRRAPLLPETNFLLLPFLFPVLV